MSINFKYIFFDEKKNEKRWVVKLENEFSENFSIKKWIKTIWTLFENEAKEWANINDDVKNIVIKKNLIEIDKIELIRLIDYEYFDKNKKNTTKIEREHDYNLKFQSIQQEKNETLKNYYKRTIELFKKLDDKNVSIVESLSILKSSFFKNIIAYYIKDIRDEKLQAEVYVKHDESIEIRSLYEICTFAKKILKTQKRQKKYQIKKIEKKRHDKLAFLDKKFMIIKVENFNSNTSIQILQSQMILLKYAIDFIFSHNRFTNFRRIRSNDRIQNVINDFAANSLIRHQQKFFSQNFRFEQEHDQISYLASIVIIHQSKKWIEEQRAQKNRDFETDKHQHQNSLFNETQIYNKAKHDHWCFKCDLLDHRENQCDCSTHQQINHAKRRFIWKTTNYNSSSRNTSYSQSKRIHVSQQQSQISYNSITSETAEHRTWSQVNNENVISQFSKFTMNQITYYNEIHDHFFFRDYNICINIQRINDSHWLYVSIRTK